MISLNPDIERLMIAMAEFEGWQGPTPGESGHASIAYRHHNPGNLRYSPFQSANVDNFAVFSNDSIGWMAFHWDLMQKAKGNTVTKLGPHSSIRDLIYTWAPPSDNNHTERYIEFVIKKTGLNPSYTLGELFGQ